MKYLKNSLCDLQPLFDINYNKKINIISCCFFKLENGSYKKFNKYTNGLRFLNNYVKKYMKDFKIRLFIDESIYNDKKLMIKINKLKLVQCVLINCKKFKSKINNTKHRGLLGTLFRFFPMFNFENNDANFVIISDIDWSKNNDMDVLIESYNILKKNNKKVSLFMVGRFFKSSIVSYNYNRHGILLPYAVADRILNNIKLDKKIIINFIKDDTNLKKTYYQSKPTTSKVTNKTFIFGIDEYFVNKTLVDYLIEKEKIFGIKVNMGITYEFFFIINKKKYSKFEKKNYKLFFTTILKGIKKFKYKNIKQAYEFIDKIIYNKNGINKLTKLQIKVFSRIYLYFIYNYNNTSIIKLFIGKKLLQIFMRDEYFGLIFINKISFFNSNYKNIILNEVRLPKKNVTKLKEIRMKVLNF